MEWFHQDFTPKPTKVALAPPKKVESQSASMDWYVYGRDQAILARQIYHEPSLLWTDPQQLRGAAGLTDHNPHDDVDDQVPKIVDESAAKGEDAKKNTTVAYFQTQEGTYVIVFSHCYV